MKLPEFYFGSPSICTYCGEPKEETDHVIPVSHQADNSQLLRGKISLGPVTYCCGECNRMLYNTHFNSFWERCATVAKKLNDKAAPVVWSDQQIKTLDYPLAKYIEREKNKRLWYRFRADWFQSRDFLLNIEGMRWENCLEPCHPSYCEELHKYFTTTIIACRYLTWRNRDNC